MGCGAFLPEAMLALVMMRANGGTGSRITFTLVLKKLFPVNKGS
jgi:hypothetical protein